jgi:DNA repair protein RecO (recombination protein O)
MTRTLCYDGLVLSVRNFGEGHREIQLLAKGRGLLRAAVFGGAKSKLKSLAAPWHSGRIWLYENPVKNSIKVTDFDVTAFRPSLRENLFKTWAASLCTELIVRTNGGDSDSLFPLVCGFLDGLDIADETEGRAGMLRFLWRWLTLMGLNPDLELCARCSTPTRYRIAIPSVTAYGNNSEIGVLYYSAYESGFICENCSRPEERIFPADQAVRDYLLAVSSLSPATVRSLPLQKDTIRDMKKLLFFLAEKAVDGKLNTLQSGTGIL